MAKLWQILVGLFKQLSDESAYERHLASHGLQHSPQEWRRFWDCRLRAKYARVKCC